MKAHAPSTTSVAARTRTPVSLEGIGGVVDLSVDGHDLAAELIAGGTHAAWDYDGGQRKPDWCTRQLPAERLASR